MGGLADKRAERQPWAVVADLRLLLCYYALLSPRPRPAGWPLPLLLEPLLSQPFLIQLRSRLEARFQVRPRISQAVGEGQRDGETGRD